MAALHPQLTAPELLQSLVEARDIDAAWQELAAIQQAGLDAALAAQSKARKPTSCKAAPAATTAAELQPQPHDSNGHAEGSLVLPDQGAAGQAGNGLAASDNGHLASEENQAANRQMSGSASMPATSMSKDQVCLSRLAHVLRHILKYMDTVLKKHMPMYRYLLAHHVNV